MYRKDIFFTVAAAAVAGLLMIAWKGDPVLPEPVQEAEPAVVSVPEAPPLEYHTILYSSEVKTSRIVECYRDKALQGTVIAFFAEFTGSEEVARAVLAQADAFDISPALAFSLAWEESRYNTRAESRENDNQSVDRGLFQLNSYSFPELGEEDFFNPETNARCGMSYLRWCLDTSGSEVPALATYNAGLRRVTTGGTPKRTLDYISRVLQLKNGIEALFESKCPREAPAVAETKKQLKSEGMKSFFRAIL
jgi:hypothetical protein